MPRSPDLEARLAFLNLDSADLERLADLEPILERHASAFVSAFYRHLLSFPVTRDLLGDPQVKDRLLGEQRKYLLSLAGPTLDAEFVENRRRIGEIHERIGLEPRWYLGAYALYLSLLIPVICDEYSDDPSRAAATVISLQKLLFLDVQLAMEAYIDRQTQELEYLTEELAKEGRRLAREYEDQSAELRITEGRAHAAEELAAVATLVAGLAHEIGTPMGVIHGHARMLEPAITDPDARWRLETIQEQTGRISNIIQTLLNMARPRRAKRQPVALEPLLEESLSFLHEKFSRSEIRVETSFESVPSITADAERLQQLFLNLFLNAADSMPDGGELRVSLQPKGEEAEIRVVDTGAGIPASSLERIFEPFFTTKPAGEGNGLGLMVAQGIVREHRGTIAVESSEGAGTEFIVRLPVAGSRPGAAAPSE